MKEILRELHKSASKESPGDEENVPKKRGLFESINEAETDAPKRIKPKVWMMSPAGVLTPAANAVDVLPAGYYRANINYMGELIMRPSEIDESPSVKISDHVEVLAEAATFWKSEDFYEDKGFPYKRGVLLHGPPGTGKTTILRELVREAVENNAVAIWMSSPAQFQDVYTKLREVEEKRHILVIAEDADALGDRALTHLLEGVDKSTHVFSVATTNYIHRLSPRVLRPGRFDKIFEVKQLSDSSREKILKSFFKGEIPEGWLAKTAGMTAADVKEVYILTTCYKKTLDDAVSHIKDRFGGSENPE